MNKQKYIVSPFRIWLCFMALVLVTCMVVPQLRVALLPSGKSSSLTIVFTLPESSPDLVEQLVTTQIEGACSQLKELKKITSVSDYNGGTILLQFDNQTDMTFKRMELANIIRQIYSRLPATAGYPLMLDGQQENGEEKSPMMVYSVNAQLQPFQIYEETELVIRKVFAGTPGIRDISISGGDNLQLVIHFDKDKCAAWKIRPDEMLRTVQSHFAPLFPGKVNTPAGEEFFLLQQPPDSVVSTINQLLMPDNEGKRQLPLKEVATVSLEMKASQEYFRVNGKNSVSLKFFAKEGVNSIQLEKEVKRKMLEEVIPLLPKGFDIRLDEDEITFLQKELVKNYRRAWLSVTILLLFILLLFRSWRYLLILFSGLIISLCLTLLFAWILQLNIHLYTIAGIAVSFGIMTDNGIVMLDHFSRWRNHRIFLPMLAGTLIALSALSLVFFLPEEERRNMSDFSVIMMLALIASLFNTFFYIPSLFQLLYKEGDKKNNQTGNFRKWKAAKRAANVTQWYYYLTGKAVHFRKTLLLTAVLGFGIPLCMLPGKWEGEEWYHSYYNKILGSKMYQDEIKPYTDKWLGGAFQLFINDVYEKSGYREPEEIKLFVDARLPYGNTTAQLNDILQHVETYLSTIAGIDKYITAVYNARHGNIQISFKKTKDNEELPYQIKSALIEKSLEWGGVEWNIYGLGQGFNNDNSNRIPAFKVRMKGYNYDELEKQSKVLADKLSLNKRIRNINANESFGEEEEQGQGYALELDKFKISLANTNLFEVLQQLNNQAISSTGKGTIKIGNHYYPMVLEEMQASSFSDHDVMYQPLQLDSGRSVRLSDFGQFQLHKTANNIHREDRQYIRMVSFEYMGTPQYANIYLKQVMKEMANEMPVGYSAAPYGGKWNWKSGAYRYLLIGLMISFIFVICSILFGNLWQPFSIISVIPLSFIGLFLTFTFGDFYFDQGGYAAFIMLGILVANNAILIVNDFNNRIKTRSITVHNRILIKTIVRRMGTIWLVTISTCVGLIPFLTEGQHEIFWFSMAVGTIGGLIFSLVMLCLMLPLLLWRKKTDTTQH